MAGGVSVGNAYLNVIPRVEGDAKSLGSKFGNELGGGAKAALGAGAVALGNILSNVITSVASTAGEQLSKAFWNYADYEQLVGGVETLFKDASQTVQNNAKQAFQTAGMSANEYMENVTSFSASLISSLDGDTAKAAQVADKAIVDMSDNANKMGTDIGRITDAYQGFAKQNYTMLDNLKLGYGGTKQEMQRLLDDAGKIAGTKFNIDSYADVIEAIHIMQDSMGITGTTMEEGSKTISGSINQLKGAWENFLTAVGDGGRTMDLSKVTNDLITSIGAMASNVVPAIARIGATVAFELPKVIGDALIGLAPVVREGLVNAFGDNAGAAFDSFMNTMSQLQSIVSGVMGFITGVISSAMSAIKAVIVPAMTAIGSVVSAVVSMIMPQVQNVVNFLNGSVLPVIQDVFSQIQGIVVPIVEDISSMIQSALPSIQSAFDTVMNAIWSVVQTVWPSVSSLITTAVQTVKAIMDAVWPVVRNLITTTFNNIRAIAQAVWPVISNIVTVAANAIKNTINNIRSVVSGVQSTFNSIKSAIQNPINAAKSVVDSVVSGIKSAISGLSSVISSARSTFNSVKSAITGPIESAKSTVKGALDRIKGMFPLSIGKIFSNLKLPHISVSGGSPPFGIAGQGSLPSFSVSWYAKGGIVDDATLIGAGEAGPEMILPERGGLMNDFADAVTAHVGNDRVVAELELLRTSLGSIIANYAPVATPRELHRINQKVNAYV